MTQFPGSQQKSNSPQQSGAKAAERPSTSPLLLAALTAERAALLNFVALLEREQGMLVENQTSQLLELSEQKSTDAFSLNKLVETRRALVHKNIPQLTAASASSTQPGTRHPGSFAADAIHAWLEVHNPDGWAVWKEVIVLAERARQLNQTNGELIQMKLRHNQQSLSVLSNAVNKANLYGPNGQTSFSPGSGRSLGSG